MGILCYYKYTDNTKPDNYTDNSKIVNMVLARIVIQNIWANWENARVTKWNIIMLNINFSLQF